MKCRYTEKRACIFNLIVIVLAFILLSILFTYYVKDLLPERFPNCVACSSITNATVSEYNTCQDFFKGHDC